MQRALMFKVLTIALLGVLLLIPLGMIEGQIRDRAAYRDMAERSVAQSWTGGQAVVGPILVVPYAMHSTERVWNNETSRYEETARIVERVLALTPESLDIRATVATERRQRGIFSVPVYTSEQHLSGEFDLRAAQALARAEGFAHFGEPFVALHVADVRGIAAAPALRWGDQSAEFAAGSGLPGLVQGLQARVAPVDATGETSGEKTIERVGFDLDLRLRGMQRLAFAPLGKNTSVTLSSSWPHPSFDGRYLPESHTVSASSFEAQWRLSQFATDVERHVADCIGGDCRALSGNTLGVSLLDPVDLYAQSERSAKYAVLFVALTFVAFFLVEVLKGLRIHPMQYLLVGLGLSLFFLLLLSLAEHIGFGPAYLGAAAACIMLLSYYCGFVLGSHSAGLALGGALGVLYGALYVILGSEDHALLMGSGLLFLTLGAAMVLTRHLDWYALSLPQRAD